MGRYLSSITDNQYNSVLSYKSLPNAASADNNRKGDDFCLVCLFNSLLASATTNSSTNGPDLKLDLRKVRRLQDLGLGLKESEKIWCCVKNAVSPSF